MHLLYEVLACTLGYGLCTHLRTGYPNRISDARNTNFYGFAVRALLDSRLPSLLRHPKLRAHPLGGLRCCAASQ